MKEKIIAKAYAKAIFELGTSNNVNVADELTKLTEVINMSNDLENVLFLDVFTVEEKLLVLNDIVAKLALSPIVISSLKYLIGETRLGLLPLIFKEIIVIDDHNKGFMRGTIEGSADSVDEVMMTKIKSYLQDKLGLNPELDYKKNEAISAGVRITVEDYQIDASIDKQLKEFKESIINN